MDLSMLSLLRPLCFQWKIYHQQKARMQHPKEKAFLKLLRNSPRWSPRGKHLWCFQTKVSNQFFFSLIPKAGLTCSKHNQKKLQDKRSSPSPVEPQDVLSEIVGSSPPQLPWLTGDFLLTATNRAPGKCARAQLPVTFLQFDMFQPCIFKKRQFRKKKSMAQPCQLPSLSILNKAEIEQFK